MRKLFVFLTVALLCYNLSATHEHSAKSLCKNTTFKNVHYNHLESIMNRLFFIRYMEMKKVLARHLYTDINVISVLGINLTLCCILIYVPLFTSSPATRLLHHIRSPSQDNKKNRLIRRF